MGPNRRFDPCARPDMSNQLPLFPCKASEVETAFAAMHLMSIKRFISPQHTSTLNIISGASNIGARLISAYCLKCQLSLS